MAKTLNTKKEKVEPVDPNLPLTEVIAELEAAVQGGGDVASRQATLDKLKAYAAQEPQD